MPAIVTGTLASFAMGASAFAQSSDALIDKLVDKGILSVKEANELREEADKDFTKSYSIKSGMPDWVTALKFNGDFRGRYDGIYSNNGSDRNRLRYRLRFGATASLTDNFEVGLRLGSGQIGSAAPSLGGSPFSANTDLGNDGSRKFLFVDLAYAKWTPNNAVEIQL
ncbi:MAG: putative porin [Limisphaerales bacterium]